MIAVTAAVAFAYALGCLQTGYYLVRVLKDLDVRDTGSGGTGASNVGRILGHKGFVVTLTGDFLKGVAAVAVATQSGSPAAASGALVAVTAGHIWPVQLGFRGGRGVAAGVGALLVFNPLLLACLVLGAGLAFVMIRHVKLCGLVGFALLPLGGLLLQLSGVELAAASGLAALVLWAHRERAVRWISEWRARS